MMRTSLTFSEGFTVGASRCVGKKETKVMDWKKAKSIITQKGNDVLEAYAGLMEDWDCTNECIFRNGKRIKEEYGGGYFSSLWATPILVIEDCCGNEEEIECYLTKGEDAQSSIPEDWED
jgi:hypothetical protein